MFLHINISIFLSTHSLFSAHSSLSYKLNLKVPNPNDLYNYIKKTKRELQNIGIPKPRTKTFTLSIFLFLNKETTLVIHYRIQNEELKSYKAPTTLVRF